MPKQDALKPEIKISLAKTALNSDVIKTGLPNELHYFFSPITVFETISSTNTYSLELTPKKSGHVCLAESQTSGRGRMGKTWESPQAENIYLSILWELPLEKRNGLSLVMGIAIVKWLSGLGISAQIKWPNDVWVNHKKIAGILIEASGSFVVVGIGININMECNNSIDQAWTSVKNETGKFYDRNILVSELLIILYGCIKDFEKQGLTKWLPIWNSIDILKDKKVYFEYAGHLLEGIAKGINQEGALFLETSTGMRTFHSGEVKKLNSDF